MGLTLTKSFQMENNIDNNKSKVDRSKKMMLWFGMISLTMSFLGITSGYIVSKERADWLTDFQIPEAFYISLFIILLSSITFYFAKKYVIAQQKNKG